MQDVLSPLMPADYHFLIGIIEGPISLTDDIGLRTLLAAVAPDPMGSLVAEVPLHLLVFPGVGHQQIPPAFETDRRGLAVDCHLGLEVAEEGEPVLGHGDVLGQAEQLADAAVAARGRGELVARIGLDHDDLAAPPLAGQMVGNTGADDAAADNQDAA